AVELSDRLAAEHLGDPDDSGPVPVPPGDASRDLRGKLGGVGLPGGKDDANPAVEVRDGVDEVDDPLLAGDPPDEQGVWLVRVDPVFRQDVGRRIRDEEGRIDTVV